MQPFSSVDGSNGIPRMGHGITHGGRRTSFVPRFRYAGSLNPPTDFLMWFNSPQSETPEMLVAEGGLTLYRGARGADGSRLLSWVITDNDRGQGRKRLEREFALRDVLAVEWAARPIELVAEQEKLTLLLTDPGGGLLSRRIGRHWDPAAFLRVAVGIAAALGHAHRAGLVHRNLSPANVLIDEASGAAWLTGFAFASRSPQLGVPEPPDAIVGTLAYMAPEQTGQMSQPVDTRSDLYALGAMFYQMLTGEFPFSASDGLEWVHCNVARQPLHLCTRRPSLPMAIAEIAMKLLEKPSEERYQTAGGLEADLRHCLKELESKGVIAMFRLDVERPELLPATAGVAPTTIEASVDQLNLATVVRVTQALSSEIFSERLIEKLMVIALEHAAAEKSLLVLQKGTELHLEAAAFSSQSGVQVHRLARPFVSSDLPVTIVLHVARSGQCVLLDDAARSDVFSRDEYIRQKAIRSVLCLPLKHQSELVGVLYFENNLATHVFTPARRAVLDLLSSQAAISLRNADLYAKLEKENVERRRSEAALRRSEERYALAIDAATDGHGEYLVDDGLFYSSPRFLEQWGLSPDLAVVPRERMLDLFPFHPDDRQRAVALLNKHRDSETKRLEFDVRAIRRGEARWMHCTTLYARDATGKLLRASVVTTDVTERKRAEEELRRSEERYALALAGSNEGVFDWDLQAGRAYFSPRTQELLGLPVGESWRTREEWDALLTYYPGEKERMEAALEAHFRERTPYDHDIRFNMAGGEVRWFRARGTALRDADGTAHRFVGSLGDITERKRQQEEMLRLESRLQQAERFEAMGTLAGGIAHDFNNILGAILGFGERALRAAREGSRMHRDLSNVVVAGERGRALVDRILMFSRGTAGERVPVHVELVVREALNLLQAKLPKHVRLRIRLQAGRAAILGDAVQIHQLLMNLGTNAAHAMTQTGTLTVSLEVIDVEQPRQTRMGTLAAGAWVVLQVADQGSGMKPEILERIFDPFFTTKEMGVGTGLGLSLVLRIVTHSGGVIDVESTPGTGSVFTVYLPHAGDAPEESHDARPAAPRGTGQRVIVVDDEEPLLELTTDALKALGYEPVGHGTAQAALEAFRASPDDFDAMVTDLRMPGMSGDELIREVRSVRPLLPVILISGFGGDIVQVPYSNSGWADEVLTKPLRVNALAMSLARLLAIA